MIRNFRSFSKLLYSSIFSLCALYFIENWFWCVPATKLPFSNTKSFIHILNVKKAFSARCLHRFWTHKHIIYIFYCVRVLGTACSHMSSSALLLHTTTTASTTADRRLIKLRQQQYNWVCKWMIFIIPTNTICMCHFPYNTRRNILLAIHFFLFISRSTARLVHVGCRFLGLMCVARLFFFRSVVVFCLCLLPPIIPFIFIYFCGELRESDEFDVHFSVTQRYIHTNIDSITIILYLPIGTHK